MFTFPIRVLKIRAHRLDLEAQDATGPGATDPLLAGQRARELRAHAAEVRAAVKVLEGLRDSLDGDR